MYPLTIPCDIEFAKSTMLSAGDLVCVYETGNLVQIRFGNQELIRKIYGAVRLHNWDTVPVQISAEEIETDNSTFKISYTAIYGLTIPLFRARYLITGNADNSIHVRMDGEVVESFSRNRIGLCVLHPPPSSQGAAVVVTRPDGSEYEGEFPAEVSPHQPFLDIISMRWTDNFGNQQQLSFEGDVFEMEDQRNWSDHSFKTYSTPASLPRPVNLKKGDKVFQSVQFSARPSGVQVFIEKVANTKFSLPRIGYVLPGDKKIGNQLLESLAKISIDHLRVTVDLLHDDWKEGFKYATEVAGQLSVKLEILLALPQAKFVEGFIEEFASSAHIFYSILPLISPEKFEEIYDRLKSVFPDTLIGYGFDDSFSNLNRNRPTDLTFDFLSFSITPQAHASDNRTIVENLSSHTDILHTARSFAKGKPIHVSPVTLIDRGLAEHADPRQYSSFLAAWALHTFQTLAGVASITFFDIIGENGILKEQDNKIIFSPFFKTLETLKEFGAERILSANNTPNSEIIFENSYGQQLKIETDILSRIAIDNQ